MCPDSSTLSAFFDSELSEPLRIDIERHIEGCPACRATLALFEQQRDMLLDIELPISSETRSLDKFWEYVGHSRVGRIHGPRRISVPLPLAAAAALAFIVVSLMNFLPLGQKKMPEFVVLDSRPQPTVVSLTITPGELDEFIAALEGRPSSDGDAIQVLPADWQVGRLGEPEILRPASLEGAP